MRYSCCILELSLFKSIPVRKYMHLPAIFLLIFSFGVGKGLVSQNNVSSIILGVEDDWAPYCFFNKESGELDGFTPIVVREAFKKVGIDVEFKVLPFSRCMHLAQSDVIAGCFNAAITKENKGKYIWPSYPLVNEPLGVFSLSSSSEENRVSVKNGVDELLSGKRVGITLGYTYPTEIIENPKIIFRRVKSDSAQLDMLLRHRIDIALLGKGSGYYLASRKNVSDKITERLSIDTKGNFYIAFSRFTGNGEYFSDMFDKGMVELINSGEYQDLKYQFERKFKVKNIDIPDYP